MTYVESLVRAPQQPNHSQLSLNNNVEQLQRNTFNSPTATNMGSFVLLTAFRLRQKTPHPGDTASFQAIQTSKWSKSPFYAALGSHIPPTDCFWVRCNPFFRYPRSSNNVEPSWGVTSGNPKLLLESPCYERLLGGCADSRTFARHNFDREDNIWARKGASSS